jgi:putative transposase
VVGPRAEREAVRVAREEGQLSERRACGLIGMNRGSWRYQRKERNEAALRSRLREIAGERPRFGYRRLHRMLRREKWMVNHKRVYRLYRGEGLAMRRRKGKRFRAEARVPPRDRRLPHAGRLDHVGGGPNGNARTPER